MGAMLGAINAKLDLVIEQLATIELALVDIVDKLNKLPQEIDELWKAEYVADKLAVMKSAMGEWIEIQQALERRRLNGSLPLDATHWDRQTADEIEKLYDRFNTARRTLMEHETGLRPDAAIFAPAAFVFDLAISLVTNSANTARLIELIGGYKKWFDRILDPSIEQSTTWNLHEASKRHDAAIASVARTTVGTSLGFFYVPPPPPSTAFPPFDLWSFLQRVGPIRVIPDLDKPVQGIGWCFDAVNQEDVDEGLGAGPPAEDRPGAGGPVYVTYDRAYEDIRVRFTLSQKETQLSPEISVVLLEWSFEEIPYSWLPGTPRPKGAEAPKSCSPLKLSYKIESSDLDKAVRASEAWKAYLNDREKFDGTIKLINTERMRMGLCSAAISACAAAQNSSGDWIRRLGG
jgi:hypothetical protein